VRRTSQSLNAFRHAKLCYNARMDAITLAAVRRELDEALTDGRVQAVVQPDDHSLALEIFREGQRRWLLLSIDAQAPRVHLLADKARRGLEKDTPFLLQARKRLRGARLTGVIQPDWERLFYFPFTHPEHGESVLAAEIMGRWSNLILNDGQGDVLTSLRYFERNARSQRIVRPGQPYQPPPPQRNKLVLDLLREADVARLLHQTPAGKPLWRALVGRIAGLSPLAARELIFRAAGDALADASHPNISASALLVMLDWLRSLPQQGGWSPTVAVDDRDIPQAFAPYELTHLGRLTAYATISAAARAYFAATLGADSYAGRRKQVLALLEQARKKLVGRRISLGEQAAGEEDVARLRAAGEWILAYAWQIKPGDSELKADAGEEILHIPLDPALSPSENAQAIFARYHKVKRASKKIPALLAQVDRDLAWLEQIESDVLLADNTPQIEELREALLASGLVATGAKKKARFQRSQPIRAQTPDGFEVIIGRNALQNEKVTWKIARPDDIWLHAQGMPGSHAIIRTGGNDIPETSVLAAASWAAYHSKARNEAKVSVIVTRKRQLRKIKGGRAGQVRVLQHRSITVRPKKPPAG